MATQTLVFLRTRQGVPPTLAGSWKPAIANPSSPPVLSISLSNLTPLQWISRSQRGVAFFRKQDGITTDPQKELAQRLGELTGKPATSKLHIHPVSNSSRKQGAGDREISVISSAGPKKLYVNSLLQ
ncbi:hypothetical protein DL768_009225 [Monosporascus sp. mg162]|nr:hypothetical protein DL768_009225 [Monosporascus sp. mg162]